MSDQKFALPPYWSRFGDFFRYPLHGEPLLTCIGIGVLSGLASLLFQPLSGIVDLVLTIAVLRYGYKVLERTARGYIEDDLVYFESAHGGKNMPYKQVVVIVVGLAICGYVGSLAGPHVALILLAIFTLVLPANTMILAITDKLGESMSPQRLWGVIRGIGMPYLGLCACLLLLISSSGGMLRLLMPVVPIFLVSAVGGLLAAYFIIVMFRLMGYALYQYHEVLGMAVKLGFEQQSAEVIGIDPTTQRTRNLVRLLKQGRYEEALVSMKEALAEAPDNQAVNHRLHRLLLALPAQESAMREHAARWLIMLIRAGQERQALEVLEGIWKRQPDFTLPLPGQIVVLARACFSARGYESVTRLIQDFDRRFPSNPEIPNVYVLGARLLIDHQRDEEQARRVLTAVLAHYPTTAASAEAQQLLTLLDRLAGTAGAVPA